MVGEEKVELKRGLRDVYIDRTESSLIDGRKGKLLYRGYNIHDLAKNSTFEETTYLLLHGFLPTRSQLDDFEALLKSHRVVADPVIQIIRLIKDAHPMDVLRTAVSAMGGVDSEADDFSAEATLSKGIRLISQVPSLVAAHARIREGKEPVVPDPRLSHAANFLYMLFDNRPTSEDARLIDKDLILHAEHGLNASTFGARVAVSTQADIYCAVTAALAILKGPLHGGAAEAVMKQAIEIGSPENAKAYLDDHRKAGERVMGFGHRVYKKIDPRAIHLEEDAKALGVRKGQSKWFSILDGITEYMTPYIKRGIVQNVDFWSGAIYYLLGIQEDMYVPIFAMGRMPGWVLHIAEQYNNNIILRPRLMYKGKLDMEYLPIGERG